MGYTANVESVTPGRLSVVGVVVPGDLLCGEDLVVDGHLVEQTRDLLRGLGRLRIPYIALPVYWVHIQAWLPATATALLVLALFAVGYHPAEETADEVPAEPVPPPDTDPYVEAALNHVRRVTAESPGLCYAFGRTGPVAADGTGYFHGCYHLAGDELWGTTRRRTGTDHTLAALRSIRARDPAGERIHIILGDTPADSARQIRQWAARANAELCYLPAAASWANPAEAPLAALRADLASHPSLTVIARALQSRLRERGAAVSATGPPATGSGGTTDVPHHPRDR
jgi:hypothetical protein